ncbi:uncharacterized protein BCR38DRAFT_135933 [Pseudomassariella vexata]|uniref:Uncharacterized protein n=1 Tax=Pseudomassariella vexata TaxID=1141098 RepID=A0A1Y2EAQ8_9PEZI|nr:uncharacterized protein BCR38DRAFT_135933 [Pseudomassariella vexata]ORY68649.1 hypothetical protein BCR38DRAFT_135933 [Pseudomassariella vexata]
MAQYAPVHDPSYDISPVTNYVPPGGHEHSPYTQQTHTPNTQPHHQGLPSETQSLAASDGQNPNVEFHEVNPYWNTGVPPGPTHQRGWSDSTIATENISPAYQKAGVLRQGTDHPVKKTTAVFSDSGPWTLEIVTILIAFAAVASIMGVLARFNGHALPEWPYYITLNALIALLATVATATMSISLQNGLSQLKWIRFKEARVPLADMETFDEASRGTWGALKLLVTRRGGVLGSCGALIAIVALALSPFAQQIVTYQTRSVIVDGPGSASVNRALNYTGALPGTTSPTLYVPILPLKSAVYNGLFAENGRPGAALAFECQTGNCTWDAYETLGVCYECVDLTAFMSRYCAPDAADNDCGWQVPQGARLNNSLDVFSMTSLIPSADGNMPHSTIMKLIFMGTEAQDGLAGDLKPWAQQCSLSSCLQTLETAVVNGVLSENMTGSVINNTVVDLTSLPQDADMGSYVTGSNNSTYLLGKEAMLSMRGWFYTLFANGSAVRTSEDSNRTITDNTVVVNLTVGISSGVTLFDSDIVTAFYWNYYEYAEQDGIAMLMSDMATSMTVAFRSFLGAAPVNGRAISVESYVHVRWGFAVLPIVVVVGTAVFLAAAMYRTHRTNTKPWKSSALAMLFHGLDEDMRVQFGSSGSLSDKKRQARGVKVQLDESDDGNSISLRG